MVVRKGRYIFQNFKAYGKLEAKPTLSCVQVYKGVTPEESSESSVWQKSTMRKYKEGKSLEGNSRVRRWRG